MSEIKPALTVEEWEGNPSNLFKERTFKNRSAGRKGLIEFSRITLLECSNEEGIHNGLHVYGNRGLLCNINAPNLHALAAFCLHKQPFGFTKLDVDRHREQAEHRRRLKVEDSLYANAHEEYATWHESMADRIEALLPPEND